MNKHITIKDIAREAGVSVSLVSFVMNNRIGADGKRKYRVSEDTRLRVLEVAHRLNYQPNSAARNLRQGRTHVIGAVLSDMSNIFYGSIARYLEDLAIEHGFTLLIGSTDENPQKFESVVRTFLEKDVEGFIVVPTEGSEDTMNSLQDAGVPMVVIDRMFPFVRVPNVVTDNAGAMVTAFNNLVERGAKRIHMVSYAMRISSIVDREVRFCQCLSDMGVENPEERISRLSFDMRPEESQQIADRLIADGCDGLVIASNMPAVSIIKALFRRKVKIQKDLRVVSFDFSNVYGLFDPAIPYIQQPLEAITRKASEILFRLIETRNEGGNIRGERGLYVYEGTLIQE